MNKPDSGRSNYIELSLEFSSGPLGPHTPIYRIFRNGTKVGAGELLGVRRVLAEALAAHLLHSGNELSNGGGIDIDDDAADAESIQ